jgi:hypothetical protein
MSKAILVLDMPSCCDECDINGIFCGDVGNNDMCRAGGCPLKEVPKQREEKMASDVGLRDCGFIDGWNACIDKIMGGSGANG